MKNLNVIKIKLSWTSESYYAFFQIIFPTKECTIQFLKILLDFRQH